MQWLEDQITSFFVWLRDSAERKRLEEEQERQKDD